MNGEAWSTVAANDRLWDVVVLGAGPAGAIAARQLARRGCRVLLVEKAPLPRMKVCGGCLGGAALDQLEAAGLGGLPQRCGGVVLRSMQLASGGSVAEIPIGRRIAVSRQTFDAALVDEAVHAGVAVCDETTGQLHAATDPGSRRVTLRSGGVTITTRARAVLLATGVAPRHAGLTTHARRSSRIGLGAIVDLAAGDFVSPVLRMACGNDGYVGVAALAGRRLDVAAAVDPQALSAARSPANLVERILREAGLPPVSGLETATWRGTPALTHQTRPVGNYRCLLIGDAAGYVEPFTGQGIGWAIQSALAASALVPDFLDTWDESVARRWQRVYAKTLLRSHRKCDAISQLLRLKPVRQLAVWSLRRAPALARPVVRQLDRSRTPNFA